MKAVHLSTETHRELSYVLLLVGVPQTACVLFFATNKRKRLVRSVSGAEVLAFSNAEYEAMLLRLALQTLLQHCIHLRTL